MDRKHPGFRGTDRGSRLFTWDWRSAASYASRLYRHLDSGLTLLGRQGGAGGILTGPVPSERGFALPIRIGASLEMKILETSEYLAGPERHTLIRRGNGVAVFVFVAVIVLASCTKDPVAVLRVDTPAGGAGAIDPSGGSGGDAGTGGEGGIGGLPGGGSGGAAGTGGTGGDGATPNVDRTSDPWIDDPETWELLPQEELWGEECSFYSSTRTDLDIPLLEWRSCGPACETADIVQGYGTGHDARIGTTWGISLDGDAFVGVLNVLARTPHQKTVRRIINLQTGSTVALLKGEDKAPKRYTTCSPWFSNAALSLPFSRATDTRSDGTGGQSHMGDGYFIPQNGKITWLLPFPEKPYCYKVIARTTDGRMFYFCSGEHEIKATLEIGSSALSTLGYSGFDWIIGGGDADTNAVFWSEIRKKETGSRIQTWSPEDPSIRLAISSVPGDVCNIGVGDRLVAGFLGDGPDCYWGQRDTRLFAFPKGSPSDTSVRLSPTLSNEIMRAEDVKSAGDFIALQAGEYMSGTSLVLARATDWALRKIIIPKGMYARSFTLTRRFLYVTKTPDDAENGKAETVERYDLNQFEQIGADYDWHM